MCYSRAEGGYRCMPSQKILSFYKGKPDQYDCDQASGAFWVNSRERLPELYEIEDAAAHLRQSALMFIPDDDDTVTVPSFKQDKVEREIMHVGNMISQYSDSQIANFHERLLESQESSLLYRDALLNSPTSRIYLNKLYNESLAKNMALGYEVRSRLLETLNDITPFGGSFDVPIKGDASMASYLKSVSQYFPSQWNRVLENEIQINFKELQDASWYDSSANEIRITNGGENFSSYKSMTAARQSAILDPRKYETQIELAHEMSHKFESIDGTIAKVSKTFVARRALPHQIYDLDNEEGIIEDHFSNSYIGTYYGGHDHMEVLSMGVESSLLGTNGSLIGLALPTFENNRSITNFRADIEHRNLTLGMLTSINMPFNNDNFGLPVETLFGMYDRNKPYEMN